VSLIDKIKVEFNKGDSPVRKLIFINVAVFAASLFVSYLAGMYKSTADPVSYFMVSSEFGKVLIRPWSILTYQFLHGGLFHILFNMIILYMFGNIYLNFQSKRDFYWIYFGSGILGAIVFLVLYNLFPIFDEKSAFLLGASGSIMGIVAATSLLVPDYEVRLFGAFNVRLKWIGIFLLASGILFMDSSNEGGRFAHLGGALFGALYMLEKQGKVNLDFSFVGRFTRNLFRRGPDEKEILQDKTRRKAPQYTTVNADSRDGSRQKSSRTDGQPKQEEIDAILDKISLSGYESLTAEEKETLFRASQ
jgi:membrane associated rhomboid family serine protease